MRLARAKPREERAKPPEPGRKHVQVVRELPDPETVRVASTLNAYVERGEAHEETARLVARARAGPRGATPEDVARAKDDLPSGGSRAKRESTLKKLLTEFDSQGA